MGGGSRGGSEWGGGVSRGERDRCRRTESRPLMPHSPRVAPPLTSPYPCPPSHIPPPHAYTMSGIFAQPYADSDHLQFYAGQPYDARHAAPYAGAGNMGSMNMASGSMLSGPGMLSAGRWWEAFGTGGFDGEPSLMEGASD